MSILSNIKAQANISLYALKKTPIAKGTKSLLYEKNLVKNSRKEVLDNLITTDSSRSKALQSLKNENIMPEDVYNSYIKNISKVNKDSLDYIKDEGLKSSLSSRFKNDKEMLNLQSEAILSRAKDNINSRLKSTNGVLKEATENDIESLVNESARHVDGKLALMTPLEMAKRYYGGPISNTISAFSSNSPNKYRHLVHNTASLGARVGATGVAVGAISTGINTTKSAINYTTNKIGGNDDER